jgi:PKD repeat protein
VDFYYHGTELRTGTRVSFSMIDYLGEIPIESVDWNFGDGTTGTGRDIDHAYSDAGNYTVTVTVTDANGRHASDTAKLTVVSAPMGVINVRTATPSSMLPVKFDSAGTTSAGGDIAALTWNFGDGSAEAGSAASHVYTRPGTYLVSLVAKDSAGRSSVTTRSLSLVRGPKESLRAASTHLNSALRKGLTVTMISQRLRGAPVTIRVTVARYLLKRLHLTSSVLYEHQGVLAAEVTFRLPAALHKLRPRLAALPLKITVTPDSEQLGPAIQQTVTLR